MAEKKSADPRLDDLAAMGLPEIWLRVAHAIGFDSFLAMWQILDAGVDHGEMRLSDNESMIEVSLRRVASFRRFQRNQFIETLVRVGYSADEVHATLLETLGEDLSLPYLSRRARGVKIDP